MSEVNGVLTVHSLDRALISHVEWCVNRVLGAPQKFRWEEQPADVGLVKAVVYWNGTAGSAALIATELVGWRELRFEIGEDSSMHNDGVHIMYTPQLGLHTNSVSADGSFTLNEHQLQRIIADARNEFSLVEQGIEDSLGARWDAELEPYRRGEVAAPVSWIQAAV